MRRDLPQQISKEIRDKFSVENNTLKRDVKENPKDRIQVEIGDSKQAEFKPQAKIMRWDNEVNFSLRAEEHPDAVVETEGKLIKYKTPEYEVHQYELDPGDIGEDGGLEFEWVLPQKPASNVLRATIQTKGLNFYYQPALTQEEIDEGASRPDNVVGSYAVYHSTKGGMNRADGMEYKVGKAFHIYRPKVTDANGNEIWGELNIDEKNGLLTVSIDQTWLDNAMYPVIVDPTFGYTSIGGTTESFFNANQWYGITTTSPSDIDSVSMISIYGNHTTASSNIRGVIVNSSLNIITNGISPGITYDTTVQWWDIAYSTDPTLTPSTTYYLGAIPAANFRNRYDSPGGNVSKKDNTNSYASPANPTDAGDNARLVSIYATYTAAAGGGSAPTDKFFFFFPLMRVILFLALFGKQIYENNRLS